MGYGSKRTDRLETGPFYPPAKPGARPMSTDAAQKGLWKLMLKLPALRGQLQILSVRNASLLSLCDAFYDASSTLEALRKDPNADGAIIHEYETLCSEIEGEVIGICLFAQNKQN